LPNGGGSGRHHERILRICEDAMTDLALVVIGWGLVAVALAATVLAFGY